MVWCCFGGGTALAKRANSAERIHVERVGAIRNHRAIHMIGSVEFIMRR